MHVWHVFLDFLIRDDCSGCLNTLVNDDRTTPNSHHLCMCSVKCTFWSRNIPHTQTHTLTHTHTRACVQADRPGLRNTADGTPLAGDGRTPREDLGGMLGWPAGDREPFRDLLSHPVLSRYLAMLCGEG